MNAEQFSPTFRASQSSVLITDVSGRLWAFDPLHVISMSTNPDCEKGIVYLNIDVKAGSDKNWLCVHVTNQEMAEQWSGEIMRQHEAAVKFHAQNLPIPQYVPELVSFLGWAVDPLTITKVNKNVIEADEMKIHEQRKFILNMTIGISDSRSYSIDCGSQEELDRVHALLLTKRELEAERQKSHYFQFARR
jgi:hypothetical protein